MIVLYVLLWATSGFIGALLLWHIDKRKWDFTLKWLFWSSVAGPIFFVGEVLIIFLYVLFAKESKIVIFKRSE